MLKRIDILNLPITNINYAAKKATKERWDSVAKPLDGMGDFEELFAQIGGIRGTADFTFEKRAVIVMCADNGIVEEHVSQTGQEVTAIVAENMGKGITSVCRMAEVAGRMYPTKVIPVDIGVNCTREIPGVLQRKVAYGTKNFLKAPAMTEEETFRAIEIGMELVRQCKEEGYEILATGEMGIGNTTTSSAMAAALLQCSAKDVTGKGAGLSKQGIDYKAQVIKTALNKYDLYQADAFTILQTVGGLDIAGLVGVFLGGAVYGIPVIIDGVISGVAALTAECLVPGAKDFAVASHKGKEPALPKILAVLGKKPLLDANLALGEGTGAVMLFPLLDMAMALYQERTTFADIAVEQYERFT